MSHGLNILETIKYYQAAQTDLKKIVEMLINRKVKQYIACVQYPDKTKIYAVLYEHHNLIAVELWKAIDGVRYPMNARSWYGMKYENFIKAFPEFGRRSIWRKTWGQAVKDRLILKPQEHPKEDNQPKEKDDE